MMHAFTPLFQKKSDGTISPSAFQKLNFIGPTLQKGGFHTLTFYNFTFVDPTAHQALVAGNGLLQATDRNPDVFNFLEIG